MHADAKPLRSQRAIRWVLFCESCVLIRRYRRQLITRETVAKVDIMNCWSDIKASSPQFALVKPSCIVRVFVQAQRGEVREFSMHLF